MVIIYPVNTVFPAVNCLKCYACGFGIDSKGCAEELTSDMETSCPAGTKSCVKSEALGEVAIMLMSKLRLIPGDLLKYWYGVW